MYIDEECYECGKKSIRIVGNQSEVELLKRFVGFVNAHNKLEEMKDFMRKEFDL